MPSMYDSAPSSLETTAADCKQWVGRTNCWWPQPCGNIIKHWKDWRQNPQNRDVLSHAGFSAMTKYWLVSSRDGMNSKYDLLLSVFLTDWSYKSHVKQNIISQMWECSEKVECWLTASCNFNFFLLLIILWCGLYVYQKYVLYVDRVWH